MPKATTQWHPDDSTPQPMNCKSSALPTAPPLVKLDNEQLVFSMENGCHYYSDMWYTVHIFNWHYSGCADNDVLVTLSLQVDSAAKLEKVYDSVSLCRDADIHWPSDFNCMLVEVQWLLSYLYLYLYHLGCVLPPYAEASSGPNVQPHNEPGH